MPSSTTDSVARPGTPRARGARPGDHAKPPTRTLRFAPDFHSRQWTTLDLPRLCFNMTVSGSRLQPGQAKSVQFWEG